MCVLNRFSVILFLFLHLDQLFHYLIYSYDLEPSLNKYFVCGTKKNPEYLILHYKATRKIRDELKQEFDIKEFSLKNLFSMKSRQDFLIKFLEKTQISTRNWLLYQTSLEIEDE